MPKASVLQFHNYSVEELLFKKVPVMDGQHEFQLHPNFNHEIIDIGENKYDVKLSVEIKPDEDSPLPFQLHVVIVGHFTYIDDSVNPDLNIKEQVLKKNTVSILFPFLRQIVASTTNNANIATLILPIMNFNDDTTSE